MIISSQLNTAIAAVEYFDSVLTFDENGVPIVPRGCTKGVPRGYCEQMYRENVNNDEYLILSNGDCVTRPALSEKMIGCQRQKWRP